MEPKMEPKKKNKKFWKGCLITLLIVVVILGISFGIGWSYIMKEHREARSLPLNKVNFSILEDGTYHGYYDGGMYQWRINDCDVTVTNGKVSQILLSNSNDPAEANIEAAMLYDRVIESQSLQVDTLSGATLTSKAYLQCVENALIPAQRN